MTKAARIISCLLALALAFSLAGCGNMPQTPEKPSDQGEQTAPLDMDNPGTAQSDPAEELQIPTAPGGADILVVYFSRTGEQYNVGVIDRGNTSIVAEMIADELDADLWEILPADDHYPMTYQELTDVAKQEQNENARPAYAGEAPELSQYSTIFIGAPVWWGDWPMILYTFFEQNADGLAGKTLIPFSTHEGSGLSGFDKKLAAVCPDSTVGQGLAIRGSDAQNKQDQVRETIKQWLTDLSVH